MAETEIAMASEGGKKKDRGTFMRIVGKIWRLKEDKQASANDEELNVKQTFKELLIYAVFLTFVCIIAFMMVSNSMYYYTKVLMELFLETEVDGINFKSISTVEHFWKFVLGAFLNGLYWEKWYNGFTEPDFDNLIYYENKLLGPPLIRQIRVTTNSCTVDDEFNSFIRECYAEYSAKHADKAPFGEGTQLNATVSNIRPAWSYRYDLEGKNYWGKLASYETGGYALELTMNKVATRKLIDDLRKMLWIRRGSRAVFLSFTVYNANINLFCVIRLAVEFPATGGAEPSWSFDTVKLIRYVTDMDFLVFFCEIIFLVFIFYYAVEELIEIVGTGYMYFFDFWNVLDILLIIMAITCTVLNIYLRDAVKYTMKQYRDAPTKHLSFVTIGFLEARFNNCVACLVFFAWVKVFKYISFNKTMTQLSTTLSRCAKDLLGFLIMFAIVFVAFTQLGYLLFGTQVDDFSTFADSFFTLFRIILGDFDFHQLEQANRILGPIFFMLFVFFVFFVLINMFLAIINDTYSEVKSDMAKQVDVFIMSDYVKQSVNRFMDKITLNKEKMEGIERLLQPEEGVNVIHFDVWKEQLNAQGYEDEEIETIFEKYDVDKDRTLDPSEQKKMLEEMKKHKDKQNEEKQKTEKAEADDLDDDEEGKKESIHFGDFNALARRVERMEASMGTIMDNIDSVLAQFKDT